VEVVRVELGEGLDFSVAVAGEERGVGLCRASVVVVRRCDGVVEGDTVLPGVVTVSDEAVVVVVVVVV
jgi:hypothetical protein